MPKATILDIGIKLSRMRHTAPFRGASFTAESSQRANPRLALVINNIVAIISIFGAAIIIDHARQTKPRPQIKQHRLKAAHITVGFQHRPADRISHTISLADWPIQ